MKTYNTLSNAISMAVAENGEIDTWGITDDNVQEVFNKNLAPYFKIAQTCESLEDCNMTQPLGLSCEDPDDCEFSIYYTPDSSTSCPNPFILSDGTFISLYPSSSGNINFAFDTNGAKGPNISGRDAFVLYYQKVNGKYTLIYDSPVNSDFIETASPSEILAEYLKTGEFGCVVEGETPGYGCSGRLMIEGKMNY